MSIQGFDREQWKREWEDVLWLPARNEIDRDVLEAHVSVLLARLEEVEDELDAHTTADAAVNRVVEDLLAENADLRFRVLPEDARERIAETTLRFDTRVWSACKRGDISRLQQIDEERADAILFALTTSARQEVEG